MNLRMLFVLPLVVAACGGGTRPLEEPERAETVVVIPEVTEEQSKKAEKEPSAPSSQRDPLAALDINTGSDVGSDMWGGSAAGGPRGGPDCSRAASLCLSFYGKQPTQNPDMLRICSNLRTAPSAMCTMIYTQFQQVVPGSGTTP